MDKYHYRDSFNVDYTLDYPITKEYAEAISDQMQRVTAAVYDAALSQRPKDKLAPPDNDNHLSLGWISAIEMVENEEIKLKRYGFNSDGDLESRDGHIITHTAFIGSADHPSGIFIPFNGDEKANIALAVRCVLGDEAAEALEAPEKYKELQIGHF